MAQDTKSQPPPDQALHGLRVLMLDDEPDTLDLLCAVLSMAGATVECFKKPLDALNNIETFGPDILVCDLYMAETDGWMFIERVRALGVTAPAVAVTAHPSAANQARALASGYVRCLAKPLYPQEFVKVLRCVADEAQPEVRLAPEDRRVLLAIARQHGHGARRPLALLDIAWAETGSERTGRAALQHLLLRGLIELQAGPSTSSDYIGWLSDEGMKFVGYQG